MRRGSNEHSNHHHYYPDRFLGGGYCKGMGDLMNEKQRAAFEALFPKPENITWAGDGYAVTAYSDWKAINYCHKWDGYQAALKSPQVQDLKDALQSILYDMEAEGNGTGYEYQNARAVLAAME